MHAANCCGGQEFPGHSPAVVVVATQLAFSRKRVTPEFIKTCHFVANVIKRSRLAEFNGSPARVPTEIKCVSFRSFVRV